jgi:hypothetical protein
LATYTPKPLICACRGEVKIERLVKWIGKSREGCVDVHIRYSIERAKKVMQYGGEVWMPLKSPSVPQKTDTHLSPVLAACNIGDGVHQKRYTCLEAA